MASPPAAASPTPPRPQWRPRTASTSAAPLVRRLYKYMLTTTLILFFVVVGGWQVGGPPPSPCPTITDALSVFFFSPSAALYVWVAGLGGVSSAAPAALPCPSGATLNLAALGVAGGGVLGPCPGMGIACTRVRLYTPHICGVCHSFVGRGRGVDWPGGETLNLAALGVAGGGVLGPCPGTLTMPLSDD